MAIILEKQFHKLKVQIFNAKKLCLCGSDEEYKGPVNPTAIISHTDTLRKNSFNYIWLAERVPRKYFWGFEHAMFDDFTHGIIIAYLDDNFELDWDKDKNIIKGLDPHLCPNGTFDGYVSTHSKVHIINILYKP